MNPIAWRVPTIGMQRTPSGVTLAEANLPAGDTWATFAWPDWVPEMTRAEIERFWAEPSRNPAEWRRNATDSYYHHPAFGQRVITRTTQSSPAIAGRWVPAWGNMARLVLDDGTAVVVSACWWQPGDMINEHDPGDECPQPRTLETR